MLHQDNFNSTNNLNILPPKPSGWMQAVAVLPQKSFARAEADDAEGSELMQQW